MSLKFPYNFQNDINSRDTSLTPIVVISLNYGYWGEGGEDNGPYQVVEAGSSAGFEQEIGTQYY